MVRKTPPVLGTAFGEARGGVPAPASSTPPSGSPSLRQPPDLATIDAACDVFDIPHDDEEEGI